MPERVAAHPRRLKRYVGEDRLGDAREQDIFQQLRSRTEEQAEDADAMHQGCNHIGCLLPLAHPPLPHEHLVNLWLLDRGVRYLVGAYHLDHFLTARLMIMVISRGAPMVQNWWRTLSTFQSKYM